MRIDDAVEDNVSPMASLCSIVTALVVALGEIGLPPIHKALEDVSQADPLLPVQGLDVSRRKQGGQQPDTISLP